MSVAAAKSSASVNACVITKLPHREKARNLVSRKTQPLAFADFINDFHRSVGFTTSRAALPLKSGDYGTSTVTSPGKVNVMVPPQIHCRVETLSRVGMLPSRTVAAPGTQGAGVLGIHGMGVKTPSAAAVAAATVGLAGDMHMPNGMMLTMGM